MRRNLDRENFEQLLSVADEEVNLFDEEAQFVLEFAGKTQIEGFTDDVLSAVETKLQSLAKQLKVSWDRRQSANSLQVWSLTLFFS